MCMCVHICVSHLSRLRSGTHIYTHTYHVCVCMCVTHVCVSNLSRHPTLTTHDSNSHSHHSSIWDTEFHKHTYIYIHIHNIYIHIIYTRVHKYICAHLCQYTYTHSTHLFETETSWALWGTQEEDMCVWECVYVCVCVTHHTPSHLHHISICILSQRVREPFEVPNYRICMRVFVCVCVCVCHTSLSFSPSPHINVQFGPETSQALWGMGWLRLVGSLKW